jgi:precorrin-3B C17-methyltransferase
LTPRAKAAIEDCQVVVGYRAYIQLIQPLLSGQRVISSGMGRERQRAEAAIDEAAAGKRVAVCSSGDAGVYGCAGLVLELLRNRGLRLPLEIIAGITAASSAAACLGAPLMNDFAVISLSDLLTPWEVIERRLEAVLAADLVLVLYNPKSRGRTWQIERVRELVLNSRPGPTPVGIVSCAGQPGEQVVLTDVDNFLKHPIGMSSTVIIGNSSSFIWQGYMVTPRGYRL